MANSKAISIRIPDELLEKIDLLAEEKYKSHKGTPNRSLVILDAIVAYFGTLSDTNDQKDATSLSDSVSIVEFNGLRDVVNTLSDSILQVKNQFDTLSGGFKVPDYLGLPNRPVENLNEGQLSIVTVSDNVINIDNGLTPVQLAERLGKKPGDVTSKKAKVKDTPDKFTEWAKKLDPDSYGWEFREEKGRRGKYYPIKSLA
jgi:predicted DNA-binding protein